MSDFKIENYRPKCHDCQHWEDGQCLDWLYGQNSSFWTKCTEGCVVTISTQACHKFMKKKGVTRPLFRRTIGLIVVQQMKRTKMPSVQKPTRTKMPTKSKLEMVI